MLIGEEQIAVGVHNVTDFELWNNARLLKRQMQVFVQPDSVGIGQRQQAE